jgi:hypothetical protein
LSFSFNSVDDFLRKAREAKSEKHDEMHEYVQDFINDPSMVGVPVEMADDIGKLMEKYGDESLRQIALFTLGKWYGVHVGVVQEMVATEDFGSAIAASMDAAKINTAIQTLEGKLFATSFPRKRISTVHEYPQDVLKVSGSFQ